MVLIRSGRNWFLITRSEKLHEILLFGQDDNVNGKKEGERAAAAQPPLLSLPSLLKKPVILSEAIAERRNSLKNSQDSERSASIAKELADEQSGLKAKPQRSEAHWGS